MRVMSCRMRCNDSEWHCGMGRNGKPIVVVQHILLKVDALISNPDLKDATSLNVGSLISGKSMVGDP